MKRPNSYLISIEDRVNEMTKNNSNLQLENTCNEFKANLYCDFCTQCTVLK